MTKAPRVNKVLYVAIVALMILLFSVYRAHMGLVYFPDSCKFQYTVRTEETAKQLGGDFAYALLINHLETQTEPSCWLEYLAVGQGLDKEMEREEYPVHISREQTRAYFIALFSAEWYWYPDSLIDPLRVRRENMHLQKYEKSDGKIFMTYMYSKNGRDPVEIPGRGPLVYDLTIEYVDGNRWAVTDFDYKWNINNYLYWLRSNLIAKVK